MHRLDDDIERDLMLPGQVTVSNSKSVMLTLTGPPQSKNKQGRQSWTQAHEEDF